MSSRELERVEVMGRVASGGLKLMDAAAMLQLSYRQVKRLWRRYQQVGRKGLKHGNAGRPSNRGKPMKLRRRVLNLITQKYSGSEAERFGPTLAAEHLAEEDGIGVDHETLRRWMLAERLWSRQRKRKKRSGRPPVCCGPGLRSMVCPAPSTRIGRTCTSEKPRRPSSCEGRSRLRSSGACVRSWAFGLLPPVRRRRRAGWSA